MKSPGKNHQIIVKNKTKALHSTNYAYFDLNKPATCTGSENDCFRQRFKQGGQRTGVELVFTGPDATFQQGTTHTHTFR